MKRKSEKEILYQQLELLASEIIRRWEAVTCVGMIFYATCLLWCIVHPIMGMKAETKADANLASHPRRVYERDIERKYLEWNRKHNLSRQYTPAVL